MILTITTTTTTNFNNNNILYSKQRVGGGHIFLKFVKNVEICSRE